MIHACDDSHDQQGINDPQEYLQRAPYIGLNTWVTQLF